MLRKPSSLILILVNLIPIGGVLWFDWSVFEILLLYWTESVTIGLINILRMASSQSNNILAGFPMPRGKAPASAALEAAGALLPMKSIKAFIIPFFIIHYGMFCYGHLTAVVSFFSDSGLSGRLLSAVPPLEDYGFWIAVAAIFLSHLFSYIVNFLGKGEYKRIGLATLMQRPYGRIVVMHITIIIGAAFVMWLDSPLPLLLVLVAMKTIVDLNLHNRERAKFIVES